MCKWSLLQGKPYIVHLSSGMLHQEAFVSIRHMGIFAAAQLHHSHL